MEDCFEPALQITRSDGNPSTLLEYKRFETKSFDGGTETVIYLADPVYSDEVAMHFVAYKKKMYLRPGQRFLIKKSLI